MGAKRYRETPGKDYLAVVVALGRQLNTLAHPQEQINAYCGVLRTICPWLEKVYFLFHEKGEDRPKRVFLCERKSRGLTIVGWQALLQEERDLLEGVLQKGRRRGSKAVRGTSGAVSLNIQVAIPLSGGAGSEGWVVFAGAGREKACDEDDLNVVAVCTDMLSASLDRASLFEKVLHAKKEWERTADAIRDVVMIIDREFVVRRGNRRLAELGDVTVEQLQGKKCYALLASQGDVCPSCPAVVTMETGQEAAAEVWFQEREAVFHAWSYPILDPSGNLESVAVYEKDITEYRRMQQQLVHAEKMGVLGQLAAAVAHELNNPLSGVISFSQILLKEMDPGLPYVEDLKNIEHAALRCKKIVEDLLAFARKPEAAPAEPVSLHEVADQALSLLRPKLEAKETRVELDLPASLPKIPIHPDLLHQVLVNLVSNARDAMDAGGLLSLKARQASERGQRYIFLSVRDTGPGIPQRDRERIFEPFFTTKGAGEGTGLGLSICRKLMESLGGSIEVSSSTAKGTTFLLKFPLS